MNAQDVIINAYEDLVTWYTLEHSCAFLHACWLLNENDTFSSKSFGRLVFSDGNNQEVYTKQERDFINGIKSEVGYYCFQMSSKSGPINCRIVSVDFNFSYNTLYDGIEFMKIFNKAFDGFNTFLFVCSEGIHLGCSCIKSSEVNQDCVISPLIVPQINWELLCEVFLYRDTSHSFYKHYLSMLGTILEIKNCFLHESDAKYTRNFCDYDTYLYEEARKTQLTGFSGYEYIEARTYTNNEFNKKRFEDELQWCFDDLNFIKTSRINPLEMLFEAEEALEQSNAIEQQNTNRTNPPLLAPMSQDSRENFQMLDNPIALVKKLKKEHGL